MTFTQYQLFKMNKLFILTILVLVGLVRTCQPPDCDRPDCGTCSNACCTLDFFFTAKPDDLNRIMTKTLLTGGPDSRYTLVANDDLTPYNLSAQYMIQGIHTTLVQKYNDTLDFVIYPLPNSQSLFNSRLRAFSISQIHGALCDDGQNYKNLVYLIKSFNTGYLENHVAGCPPPNNP